MIKLKCSYCGTAISLHRKYILDVSEDEHGQFIVLLNCVTCTHITIFPINLYLQYRNALLIKMENYITRTLNKKREKKKI